LIKFRNTAYRLQNPTRACQRMLCCASFS